MIDKLALETALKLANELEDDILKQEIIANIQFVIDENQFCEVIP